MNTKLDIHIAQKYKSFPQKIRVITETWVLRNGYCPGCGSELSGFKNNSPVADFLCENCREEFELKSRNAKRIENKIVDGAYHTMIHRIEFENNPNFFFLTYYKANFSISNFMIIPKFYFQPEIIEKRKPLSSKARRAGWIGCNILLQKIPESGRIYYIKNYNVIDKNKVLDKWSRTLFIKTKKGESKGWVLDIMRCIDKIDKDIFYLNDVYKFEKLLKEKYPENNFIKDKIRQQLQILRDKGFIEFLGNGKYKKIHSR